MTADPKIVEITDISVSTVTPSETDSVVEATTSMNAKEQPSASSVSEDIGAILRELSGTGVEIVPFTDTKATEREFPKFKAQEKRAYRVGFPIPVFQKIRTHFAGRRFRCIEGVCCDRLGISSPLFGTPVVVYETTSRGEITLPFEYTVQCFVCPEDRAHYLQEQNKEFPFIEFDVSLVCTEAQFQKFELGLKKGAIWAHDPDFRNKILEECKRYLKWIPDRIGAKLTAQEIIQQINSMPGGSASTVGGTVKDSFIPQGSLDFSSLFKK